MKKTLSVFLAVLMTVFCLVPAFAAEGDEIEAPDSSESTVKHTVTFQAPSFEFEGGYLYAVSVDGEIQYEPDENGEYVFFDGRYMLPSNIVHEEDVPDERFSPVQYTGSVEVAYGETVAFKVVTSEKYNVHTAAVFINGEPARLNAQDEYTVYVDRDLLINVAEYDANGQPALLRNHFNVQLTSGDGYKVKTLKNENYNVVYYGDSFYFRVHISKGYSASGIKVSVQRGKNNDLSEFIGEDFDIIGEIMGTNEALTSYGIDEDGCRLYRIDNITTDCKIIVSGVQEEASAGIMSFLKRILRLILNFFGIHLDFLDSITAYYSVNIDASQTDGVTYTVIRSSSDELSPNTFNVTGGDGITIVVTKKDFLQDVNVMWTPGNELGTYQTEWITDFNTVTGEVTYSAVYNIDNISADTRIVIS
ncbi:MAG: hypothetical protein E7573_07305 [Ruminococcaceae bacterium]|nr:hypothetical protein [Oscillospiraceae bacterium]MBR3598125.1 hypothetical protein [Clostridia bacterium]